MAQTLFSLLDLFASRFRSNSDNENGNTEEPENNNGNNLVTLTVSDAEPQPRSRSHTETTRPTNLLGVPNNNNNNNLNPNNNNRPPNKSPNRSPVMPRQQRSMTTVQDPNKIRPKSLIIPRNPDGTPNLSFPPTTTTTTTTTINTTTSTNDNNSNTEIKDSILDPSQTPSNNNNSNHNHHTTSISMHDSVKPLIEITSSQDDNITASQDGAIELQEYIDQESDNVNFASETPIDSPDFPDDIKETPVPFDGKQFSKSFFLYFGVLLLLTLLVGGFSIGYGLFEMYAGCRFTVYKFTLWPAWGIAMHALSRVFLNFFLCMFPYLLLFWFFGDDITRKPLYVSFLCSSGASAWSIYNTVHPKLNPTLALLPSYGFFVIAMVFSSHYVGHRIKSPTFRHLFMGQFISAAITLVLYDFVIVPFYVEATSIQKSVVRIIIHPGISALNLFISRSCSSRINPHHPGTQAFPVLIFMWFSTYYGRFFNSNMSLTMMTITMSIVSILELVWRTTLKPRDKQIVNSICGFCFKKQLTHSADFNKIYREFLRLEQLYENVSIATASCIYLAYYNIFDPNGLSYYRILSGMAIQFALEWVTDAISMFIETKYYKMDVLSFQKPPRGFYVMIVYTFLLGMAYSTSRIILITHGEWLTDVPQTSSSLP